MMVSFIGRRSASSVILRRIPRAALIVSIVIVAASLYYTYSLGTQIDQYGDVTVQEAKRLIEENPDLVVLDVRTPSEYEDSHLPRAINIPIDDLLERMDELERDDKILVYCRTGNRSTRAVRYLNDNDFTKLYHMVDGIVAWIDAGYPIE